MHAQASALVLAGGRSSRLGQPKALLPFDGEPVIARVVARLQPLFRETIVVAARDQELPPMPARVVRDQVDHQGPVAGICFGLEASATDVNFVVSCDSVFLKPALVAHLLSLAPGHDAVVPRWEERLQPLQAVYRSSVLPIAREQLARGELRLGDLFARVRARAVEEEEVRRFDPQGESFFNINTLEDYADALRRWRQMRTREAPLG
jgi:molybdopterin-guanine dinucleotide biosynthesis protein A